MKKIFSDEIYSTPPAKIIATNRIVFNHIDEAWSIELFMIVYKTSDKIGFRYMFEIIASLPKQTCGTPLKKRNAQSKTNEIWKTLTISKRSLVKIECDRGADFYLSVLQKFLTVKNINHYSRFTDKGPRTAERAFITIRYFLKKPLFLKGNADWITKIPSLLKQ